MMENRLARLWGGLYVGGRSSFVSCGRPAATLRRLAVVAFLAVSIASSWWAATREGGKYAVDFIFPYLLSHSVLYGEPIYERQWQLEHVPAITGRARPGEGIFYPAGTGFATLPFVAMSFHNAERLWLVVLIAAVVFGIRTLVRTLDESKKHLAWMVVAGLVLLSSSVRWGITHLQGAPFVMGLLCLFVACLDNGKYLQACAITTYVLVFKFTVALPFVGLLLLHQRFREIASATVIAGIAHVVGFARIGGLAALRAYTEGVGALEVPGSINTPNPWDPASSPRIDWTYLYMGLTGDLQLAKRLSLLTTVLIGSWLLWSMWRLRDSLDKRKIACMLLALTSLGMLCVYHHHYDLSAVLVPLLMLGALHWTGDFHLPAGFLLLVGPLVAMATLLPLAMVQRLLFSLGGPTASGYMNIAFPACVTLALAASCLLLGQLQAQEGQVKRVDVLT
jgi:hypothetical protein